MISTKTHGKAVETKKTEAPKQEAPKQDKDQATRLKNIKAKAKARYR